MVPITCELLISHKSTNLRKKMELGADFEIKVFGDKGNAEYLRLVKKFENIEINIQLLKLMAKN